MKSGVTQRAQRTAESTEACPKFVCRLNPVAGDDVPNIWVDQEFLDWVAEGFQAKRQFSFDGKVWMCVTHWGGYHGPLDVMGAEAVDVAGQMRIRFVGERWVKAGAADEIDQATREFETKLQSPWNIERAAKLAGETIEGFKAWPEWQKRSFLIDAHLKGERRAA